MSDEKCRTFDFYKIKKSMETDDGINSIDKLYGNSTEFFFVNRMRIAIQKQNNK